jgi:thiamine-phosphate pyrophosphorylase
MNIKNFKNNPPKLYVLTGTKFTHEKDHFQIILETLEAGCRLIQLREKNMTDNDLFYFAKRLRELTNSYNAYLIINDRVDIALAVDADGVHLGQEDMPVDVVRKLIGYDKIIGLSTHSIFQAIRAQELDVDYIGAGPVYATQTKEDVCKPVGLDYINKLVAKKEKIKTPFYAIGGIKLHNVDEVLNVGAKNIAVVTGIITDDNVRQTTESFLKKFKNS